MFIKRRDFIKGLMAASIVPYAISAAQADTANSASTATLNPDIIKSIKANFGGNFSVLHHDQSNGLTHATITHLGNHYRVASADLQNWKVLCSSLRTPVLVFTH